MPFKQRLGLYASSRIYKGEAKAELYDLKNREKQEIDFLIVKDNKPWLPIEVKLNDESLSPSWPVYFKHLPCRHGIQIVKKPGVKLY